MSFALEACHLKRKLMKRKTQTKILVKKVCNRIYSWRTSDIRRQSERSSCLFSGHTLWSRLPEKRAKKLPCYKTIPAEALCVGKFSVCALGFLPEKICCNILISLFPLRENSSVSSISVATSTGSRALSTHWVCTVKKRTICWAKKFSRKPSTRLSRIRSRWSTRRVAISRSERWDQLVHVLVFAWSRLLNLLDVNKLLKCVGVNLLDIL